MAQSPRPRVYTIPSTQPFADSLAAGLLARVGDDPLALSRMLVLLPTRRSGRTLADAFLRQSGGRALILPRMQPIGDVDEDELLLQGGEEMLSPESLEAPPAISEIRRQLKLAELILAKERHAGSTIRADQAAWLAAELARLLDQVQTERLSLDALPDLVEGDLAVHWRQTLQFLEILTRSWPEILREMDVADPAERRNEILAKQAAHWRDTPPDFPVFAAGSTGSIPASADLLKVVAGLPDGAVVLPGLDTGYLDEEAWRALPPNHPQFGMARLLDHLDLARADVGTWTIEPRDAPVGRRMPEARARLAAETMRPAASLDTTPQKMTENQVRDAMRGVTYIEAPGLREEAGVIALILREALEPQEQGEPPRTAALVTPDRELARRVAAELRRWRIEIDDSAGEPLDATPPTAFLRLVAHAVFENLAPVPLLALLKHPLAAAGLAPAEMRRRARLMERWLLRGPRPGSGAEGLRSRLAEMGQKAPHRDPIPEDGGRDIEDLIDRLEGALGPLIEALAERKGTPVPDLMRAHLAAAESLAASDAESGSARLWATDAGEAAADFAIRLIEAAQDFADIVPADYPGFLEAMLAGQVVRPRYGRHPRLAILGPLEARLTRPDLMVIGGLNEGNWPRDLPPDPWMSRQMRAQFGLPSLERRIGLSAHDFQQAFCAPRVVLTRAAKVDNTPSVPSRWLRQLETVLRGAGLLDAGAGSLSWPERLPLAQLARLNDPGESVEIARPAPSPPKEARPPSLSITEVEKWMRDPYEIYARHILKLSALDPLDADPGAAERGSFIHDALDAFVQANPMVAGEDAVARLLELGRAVFGDALSRPSVWAFWWPRFEAIARWFVDHELGRTDVEERFPERRGNMTLELPGGAFTLRGRADRIDRLSTGAIAIIDYKTGAVPTKKDIAAGVSPQLALEAVMVADGAFDGVRAAKSESLEYWKLTGGRKPGEVIPINNIAALTAEAAEGLRALVTAFQDPAVPFAAVPREQFKPNFTDYGLLERIGEWRPERNRQ